MGLKYHIESKKTKEDKIAMLALVLDSRPLTKLGPAPNSVPDCSEGFFSALFMMPTGVGVADPTCCVVATAAPLTSAYTSTSQRTSAAFGSTF